MLRNYIITFVYASVQCTCVQLFILTFLANHMKLLNGCMSRMVRARYNYNPGVDSPNENDADVRE